jgi:surfactin family lipopeptide synthetase C
MKLDNVEDIYPLSPLQEGMLFHTLLSPGSGMYFEQLGFPLSGALDLPSFERAWQKMLDRHTILRTSFHWEDLDKPLQVVQRHVNLPVTHLDWSSLSAGVQEQRLEAFLTADRERGFELSEAPLLRLTVITLADGAWYIVFSLHHLLLDGWSSAVVYKEAAAIYEAACRGEQVELPPCRPYGDYIAWLQHQDLLAAESFWRRMLTGYAGPSTLGVGPARAEDEGCDDQQIQLSTATTMALQSMARQHQLTLNTLVQGAWALLLSHYSGDDDVVFGYTVSGRPGSLAGVETMVGLFINTLPLRVQISSNAPLIPWLKQIQARRFEASKYEYSPLVKIQEWSQTPRGTALFDSIVDFGNFPIGGAWRDQRSRISGSRNYSRTNYPLNLLVWPSAELLKIIYSHSRYDCDAISRMLGHLRTILEGMVAGSEQRLGDLPLLTEPERRQLLVEWNQTETSYPRDKCIHELFESQADETPDALAVVFQDQQLTYRELNRRANQLAYHLKKLGAGPEAPIGICLERSVEMLVGLLAILKAGGAYQPLDPACPEERLLFMLQDAGAKTLLTQGHRLEQVLARGIQVISVDGNESEIALESEENPVCQTMAAGLAYIMYTSGSTGKPKAVSIPHRAVVRLVRNTSYADFGPNEVFLQFAPLSFDASTFEIWGCLLNGGRLVVLPPWTPSLEELGQAVQRHGVTTLWLTAPIFHDMVEGHLDSLKQLRQLLAGGDVLSVSHVARAAAVLKGCRLINGYGPTENTTFTCTYAVDDPGRLGKSVPIGRPIANTQVYVLDRSMKPVAIGIPGELYAGGDGVALGYFNHPDLTAESFVPNPFIGEPGARLYKTGDLVRYRPDGDIEFLGRIDDQVKIRGFRVEPGEIESILRDHPAVQEAVVVERKDRTGERCLAAYIVPRSQVELSISEVRQFLEHKLPEHMVPSVFALLDSLPLRANGKVDRRALPPPGDQRPVLGTSFVEPRTPLEKDLAGIWSDILGVWQIGVNDNFFHLGGHSLLAMRVVSRVRGAFQIELPLRKLFESPTVAGLARCIEEQQAKTSEEPIPQVTSQATEAEVQELSDEEVNTMLLDILGQRQPE